MISFNATFINSVLFISSFISYSCEAKIEEGVDQMGFKTLSHYDQNDKLVTLETYKNEGSDLFSTERYEWHSSNPNLLTLRSLEDGQGNVLINQTLIYDEAGNLLEEIFKTKEETPFELQTNYYYNESSTHLKRTSLKHKSTSLPINTYAFKNPLDYLNTFLPLEAFFEEEKETLLHMAGHYTDNTETGVYNNSPHCHEKVKITFTNGILNKKIEFMESLKTISVAHGDAPVNFVFRPTEGWCWDLLKSTFVKLGHYSPEALALAQMWKSLIAEMGGTESDGLIFHYAHSIGATNTYMAKFLISPEEQKMIKVITFGSPTIIPNEGFQSVINYINVRDGVPFLDPIGHLHSLFYDHSHIVFVGSYYGIPIFDHALESETYKALMKLHGKYYVDLFGKIGQE